MKAFGLGPKIDTSSYAREKVLAEELASNGDYNQAAIHLFKALEKFGGLYWELGRKPAMTAREYGMEFAKRTKIDFEEVIEPIILQFEIAKYSPFTVSNEDFEDAMQLFDIITKKAIPHDNKKKVKGGKKRAKPRKTARKARAKT